MGDVTDLRSRQPTSHDDEFNSELVRDLARFSEGLVTEKDIKRRYRFDESTWESLNNDALIAAVEDEKTRRVRSGALKRERAQNEIVDAAPILGKIMRDPASNSRHVIDAVKAIDTLAVGGTEAGVPAADRFIISIVLNADGSGDGPALHFNKSIRPLSPGEIDPDDSSPDIDTGVVVAIAMKNPTENGGGSDGQPV